MKRVATLYRVSTKGQLDGNDIPMQQRACKAYIDSNPNWHLTKEYIEKGISGFKVSEKDRDVIQQAKEDAEKNKFDVLLVFMFDRLGRKDDETPFVLEWFVNKGIEMWSVVEGQQKIEQHTDRLVNYLRFWQSSGESRKTSERVDEKHSQMVEDGIFRGGGIPYGYKTIESGKVNKKGKPLLKLIIDDIESEIVKTIYHLALKEGYGQLRIAQHLNELGIPSQKSARWGAATINVILKNPIYKGIMRYRSEKKSIYSKPQQELIIIKPDDWDKVQILRNKKNPKNRVSSNDVLMSTKSEALFSGMARCGVCKSKMTLTKFINKYKNSNGEVVKYKSAPSYRCSGKWQNKTNCDGQSTFSSNKIDKIALEEVHCYLNTFKEEDLSNEIEVLKNKKLKTVENEIKKSKKQLESFLQELNALTKEVTNVLLGKSSFNAELLNQIIENKNCEINELKREIESREEEHEKVRSESKQYSDFYSYIMNWEETFKGKSSEGKKMMLSSIINEVLITKEGIEIDYKITVEDYSSGNFMLK